MVVIGLSDTEDTSALLGALKAANLSPEPLQVVELEDSDESVAGGIAGAGILTGDPGTAVPGINPMGGGATPFFRNEELFDRLGDFEIPDSETDNYIEALENGKVVMAYFAQPEQADGVEQAFRSAGLINIRRYGGDAPI